MDAAVAEILALSSTVLVFAAKLANSVMVQLGAHTMDKFNAQENRSAAVSMHTHQSHTRVLTLSLASGETCGRNAAGQATCNGQSSSGNSITVSADNATPVDTNISAPTSGASSSGAAGSNSGSSSTRSSSTISTTARTTTTVAPSTSATSTPNAALRMIPGAASALSLGALALFIIVRLLVCCLGSRTYSLKGLDSQNAAAMPQRRSRSRLYAFLRYFMDICCYPTTFIHWTFLIQMAPKMSVVDGASNCP